jgi:xanthine dehydrogenase accessory factor
MDGPPNWIDVLAEHQRIRRPCAMVVVTGVRGSAPREVGARMIVADGRIAWGTIGGGNLEHQAVARCVEMLASGQAGESADFPLGERAGQCCGGEVSLFFETFPWTRRQVVIFGAGHVAQALGGLAPWLGAEVLLIDSRELEELHPPVPPQRPYGLLVIDAPEDEVERLPAEALVVVMTHSHALDELLLERALRRGAFPYVGLIGSERKWARFRRRLAARGVAEEDLARVRCPIGLTRGSKEPNAIALSVAAELSDVMARLSVSAPADDRGTGVL